MLAGWRMLNIPNLQILCIILLIKSIGWWHWKILWDCNIDRTSKWKNLICFFILIISWDILDFVSLLSKLIVFLWQVFVSTLKFIYQLIAEKITVTWERSVQLFCIWFQYLFEYVHDWDILWFYNIYPLCKSVVMVTINLYKHIIHQWKYRQLSLD